MTEEEYPRDAVLEDMLKMEKRPTSQKIWKKTRKQIFPECPKKEHKSSKIETHFRLLTSETVR